MFEGINARVLQPAELREVAQVTRTVETMTGMKISLRDDALFQKLENILHGMGKRTLLRELQDLECCVAHRLNQSTTSISLDSNEIEIDEEYSADGRKVTVQKDICTGMRVKYYDYADN
jgi:hypothetical protein